MTRIVMQFFQSFSAWVKMPMDAVQNLATQMDYACNFQEKLKRKNNDKKSPISIITTILVAFFVFFEVIKPPFLRTMAIRFA